MLKVFVGGASKTFITRFLVKIVLRLLRTALGITVQHAAERISLRFFVYDQIQILSENSSTPGESQRLVCEMLHGVLCRGFLRDTPGLLGCTSSTIFFALLHSVKLNSVFCLLREKEICKDVLKAKVLRDKIPAFVNRLIHKCTA